MDIAFAACLHGVMALHGLLSGLSSFSMLTLQYILSLVSEQVVNIKSRYVQGDEPDRSILLKQVISDPAFHPIVALE